MHLKHVVYLYKYVVQPQRMSRTGTTTVECKSGYGLEWDAELKLLRVLERARGDPSLPSRPVLTFLGAHSRPPCALRVYSYLFIIYMYLGTVLKECTSIFGDKFYFHKFTFTYVRT